MPSLLEKLKIALTQTERYNFRDRRGHYASSNLSCLRDQYWSWKGIPSTNPTDYIGAIKMMVGDAVEKALVGTVMPRLSAMGINVVGAQVPCGGSNPNWDGYMDVVVGTDKRDGDPKQLIIEIKTKSGYGADLLWGNPVPTDEYLTQLGLYLKDSSEKGGTAIGCLLYILMSDKCFGEIIILNCKYDPSTTTVSVVNYERSDGVLGTVDASVDLKKALARWDLLNKHIADNFEPKGEYQYRYPLTPEFLETLTDAKLRKVIDGSLIPGDWQVKYSRYKDLQLKTDNVSMSLSQEELDLAKKTYRSRHPKSKI